ncbi:hypothetical protein DFH29DRAFT_937577 [Suillus ampliporus]|nr:hypothetical protein DFH29DRAFT_937577 [Suillus ampliporus]
MRLRAGIRGFRMMAPGKLIRNKITLPQTLQSEEDTPPTTVACNTTMSYNYTNNKPPSAPGPLVQCMWGGPYGLHCNHIFDSHGLADHLREFHGIQGADHSRVYCMWNYCNMELNKENLSRHVEEMHLRIIYPCNTCNKTFTRRYNLNKHKNNCPGQQQ